MERENRSFGRHRLWILTALLTAPLAAVAAGAPNVFMPGTLISSAAVNQNFANLADRLTAAEASLQRTTTATVVMDNMSGPLPAIADFNSSGGNLQVIVSGTAWTRAAGEVLQMDVALDGKHLGVLKVFANQAQFHMSFPTRSLSAIGVAAGHHTVSLTIANVSTDMIVTDALDYFSVTVVESAH